jgi:pyrroline-5-carboxylate reductase
MGQAKMQTVLGFIGTGSITAAMVRGLKGSALRDRPVVLSPRNEGVAAELAATFPGVTVAVDNQAVIDGADMVILAVRPQIAESVLRPLRFRDDQHLVSLIAGVPRATVADWTGTPFVTCAIPLPFVERQADATPVHPPEPAVLALFDALGQALPVPDAATFEIYSAAGAVMATYFGLVETAAAWATAQGLPPADARAFMASLFGNLGDVLRHDPRPLDALRLAHSTAGGLNEQVHATFAAGGGPQALAQALSGVLRRVRGV